LDNWKTGLLVLIGIAFGVGVALVLTRYRSVGIVAPPQYVVKQGVNSQIPQEGWTNEESWDMKEMPDGSIKVVVHRKVQKA